MLSPERETAPALERKKASLTAQAKEYEKELDELKVPYLGQASAQRRKVLIYEPIRPICQTISHSQ